MYPDDNDTLYANNQFDTQPNDQNESDENEGSNERSNNLSSGKKLNMKDAAVFVGGGVAGASASMAANAFGQSNEQPEENNEQEPEENAEANNEQETEPTPEPAPAPRPQPQPTPQPQPEPQPTPQPEPQSELDPNVTPVVNRTVEPNIYQENDVKIQTIRTSVTEDGDIVHTASGTVNGHDAIFVDDGHGNVMGYAVDNNDNHWVDDDEIVMTDGQGMTMGNLAEHMVEADVKPEPISQPSQSGEVQVIAIENDLNVNGQNMDVAVVMVEGSPGLMIDVTQNGEADVVALDDNRDGYLSQDEAVVVTDAHVPMPTEDDVYRNDGGSMVNNNELPDYSNDNDITLYDV